MSMKLSYRDQVILVVVAVLVILGIGIFTILKPKYEDLQVSKERLTAKEDEKAQVDAKMNTLEGLKKQLEDDINAVSEDQEQFLSEKEYGETYQISQYLMEKLSNDRFEITGVNMNLLESTPLTPYWYNKRAVAYPMKVNADINGKLPPEVGYAYTNEYPEEPAGVSLATSLVAVSYKCQEAEDLLNAIQTIADNDKNMYVMTFSGSYLEAAEFEGGESPDAAEAPYSGVINIEVYEIYPLDPADLEDTE